MINLGLDRLQLKSDIDSEKCFDVSKKSKSKGRTNSDQGLLTSHFLQYDESRGVHSLSIDLLVKFLQGRYVFISISLFVHLLFSRILQTFIDGLLRNLLLECSMGQGRTRWIFLWIRIRRQIQDFFFSLTLRLLKFFLICQRIIHWSWLKKSGTERGRIFMSLCNLVQIKIKIQF